MIWRFLPFSLLMAMSHMAMAVEVQCLIPMARQLAATPELVSLVDQRNQTRHLTLDDIMQLDKRWQTLPDSAPEVDAVLQHPIGVFIRRIQQDYVYIDESFVTGNQGELIAATNKLSDYWQGDEDQHQVPFRNGSDSALLSPTQADQSSHSFLQKVSVPILKGEKTIGVLTLGVNEFVMEVEQACGTNTTKDLRKYLNTTPNTPPQPQGGIGVR